MLQICGEKISIISVVISDFWFWVADVPSGHLWADGSGLSSAGSSSLPQVWFCSGSPAGSSRWVVSEREGLSTYRIYYTGSVQWLVCQLKPEWSSWWCPTVFLERNTDLTEPVLSIPEKLLQGAALDLWLHGILKGFICWGWGSRPSSLEKFWKSHGIYRDKILPIGSLINRKKIFRKCFIYVFNFSFSAHSCFSHQISANTFLWRKDCIHASFSTGFLQIRLLLSRAH